ncbi:MAG TPA: ATP-binding protein [Nannocystaceae bacterium]|nr:ATP-binding protein [Nannocystaceae bacterium]
MSSAELRIQQLEHRLQQTFRLESIGQLAAGIAHEINTPTQYISDAAHFVRDALGELLGLLDRHQALAEACRSGASTSAALAAVDEFTAQTDLQFLRAEIAPAIASVLEGAARVAEIVRAMNELSHPGSDERLALDLNHAIETALRMTRHETKHVARVVTEFGVLPPVRGVISELGKVLVNLVVNARDAIVDARRGADGMIRIRTWAERNRVIVEVADNGTGMTAEVRERIFDPFFTTKPVGQGTGQGLAIAWHVVVDRHRGNLRVESSPGVGTAFRVELPIAGTTEIEAMS